MSHNAFRAGRAALCLAVILGVAACSSDNDDEAKADAGKRIAVLDVARKPISDNALTSFTIEVPEPAVVPSWPQNGGTTQHVQHNNALSDVPEKIWSTGIGTGSNNDYKLLSTPVVDNKIVYAMDARGRVSATSLADGDRLWRVETSPEKSDGDAMGGGIAVYGDTVYATSGFGEVLALRAVDGAVKWRQTVGKPLRSAPTVSEGRVFVITIENETFALQATTGNVIWRHSGIAENATLMGSSSPAVHGATVVVAYSSGEVFGLRAQNGRVVWGDVLAVPTQIGALPAIADIRGLPVIDNLRVFTVSHSGRMASLDERTGSRAWEADLGGVNTPAVIGNAIYMVTLDNELVALSRDEGRVIWTQQLQKNKDPENRESKVVSWWGPVVAGTRLWLTNSLGELAAYSLDSGAPLFRQDVGGPFFLPPIVANQTMLLLDNDGTLIALK